jgi:hypothetical protein
MSGRLNNSAWTTVTGTTLTDDENKALLEAAIELDGMTWAGLRVDTTQAMEHPRQLLVDPDSPSGSYVGSTTVHQDIKNAQMELAFQYIKAGTIDVAAPAGTDGIKRSVIGPLETEYFGHGSGPAKGLGRYPRVSKWVKPFLANSSAFTARLVRG